ncbi:hypothetical protein BDV97DRAFT_305827 [Delphinella strobiligena]|nr:hypothetical protein BDV97DRAFT_305827 [Delphinella strobiligena]
MSQQPYTIIGAGLSGLTLSRCLLSHGISSVIYEKASPAPRNGYGITLDTSTYAPLLRVLGMDEKTFRRRVAVDGAVGGDGRIDTGKYSGRASTSSLRANRARLEELLREGVDVRWDHVVSGIETNAAGNGTAVTFKNRERITPTHVFGVEGPHSVIRNTLLPHASLNILPFVAFNGKRRVPKGVYAKLYAPALRDSNVIEVRKPGGTVLHVSLNEKKGEHETVSISWIYSRPARGKSDACYKPNRPLDSATDTPEEFFQEVAELQNLEQPFEDVFDVRKLRKERILSWLMRTMEDMRLADLQGVAEKKVFLLGDSVHAEAILGGAGANVAIMDGVELAEHIATTGIDSIAQWYESRYPVWRESLKISNKTIEEMHEDGKSVL